MDYVTTRRGQGREALCHDRVEQRARGSVRSRHSVHAAARTISVRASDKDLCSIELAGVSRTGDCRDRPLMLLWRDKVD